MTHDATTSDLLTVKDALGNVTTMTWSNGLKLTTTDALGRITTLNWDSTFGRNCRSKMPLGYLTSFGYDLAGNQITLLGCFGKLHDDDL